jgi:tetratricopeptide (TPR) repeat protein
MKSILIIILSLLLSSVVYSTSIHDQLKVIDNLFDTRDKDNHISLTLELIDSSKEYVTTQRHEYELHWRYARSASRTPEYLNASKSEKLAILDIGVERGLKATELYPTKILGHYWYAVALGRQAELKGIFKSLSSVKPIHATMKTILDLDPYFHRAHFVLSRLYRKAPKGISIGNPNLALKHINEALSLDPKESMYLLEKARVLVKLKKKAQARSLLRDFLNMPYNPRYFKDQVERDKKEAQELLDKIS